MIKLIVAFCNFANARVSKGVPVRAFKTCMGSRGIDPLILKLCAGYT
jgi:hypothetical protein